MVNPTRPENFNAIIYRGNMVPRHVLERGAFTVDQKEVSGAVAAQRCQRRLRKRRNERAQLFKGDGSDTAVAIL